MIYSIWQHAAVFAIVLAAPAFSEFALAYGAYASRKDKAVMARYIGVMLGLAVAFVSAYAGV